MKRSLVAVAALALVGISISSEALGQRGMGEPEGVARQMDKPGIVHLSGTIREVKMEACKMTTGRSQEGTHIVLTTSSGDAVEIHLGPADEVGKIIRGLAVDQQVSVAVFRTGRLPKSALVAQTLTVDDKTVRLRDKGLRPVWAGGGTGLMTNRGTRKDSGQGRWNVGPFAGRGGCVGYGRGQGRGAMTGRGQRRGRGRG